MAYFIALPCARIPTDDMKACSTPSIEDEVTFDELIYRAMRVVTWAVLITATLMGIKLQLELALLLWLAGVNCFWFSIWIRENSKHYKSTHQSD